jgi:hypothetical protein
MFWGDIQTYPTPISPLPTLSSAARRVRGFEPGFQDVNDLGTRFGGYQIRNVANPKVFVIEMFNASVLQRVPT